MGLFDPLVPGVRLPGRVRLVFWACFLAGAVLIGIHHWVPLDKNPLIVPLRVEYNIRGMASADPKKAAASWFQVYHLFNTSWQAYYRVLTHVGDERPIHFRFTRSQGFQSYAGRPVNGFWAAPEALPGGWPAECRTVGHALLAVAYDDGSWGTEFSGDWQAWWKANKHRYVAPPDVERREPR
ncbi:MAG: hypothetical protein HY926_15020 [Elusimicrobia bacterium]|nr:hypothetical protein [Elusimicrobiota bacterium]